VKRIMLTLLAAAVAALPASAQENPAGGPERMGPPSLERLKTALDLDSAQAAQVGALLEARRTAVAQPMETIAAMRKARRAGAPRDSLQAMRPAVQEAMRQIRQADETVHRDLRALLRPDQVQKFDRLHAKRRHAMRQGAARRGQHDPTRR